jgi:Sulfatase
VAAPTRASLTSWLTLAVAVVLLNASLTFANLWPTPAIRFGWQLSVEAAILVLALMALGWSHRTPSPRLMRVVAGIWVALIVGHYAEVTATGLYGREINLFWDVRYMSSVVEMMSRVASWRLIAAILVGSALVLGVLYAASRWAIGRVARAASHSVARGILAALSVATIVWFTADRLTPAPADPYLDDGSAFAAPLVGAYGHQVQLALTALAARAGAVRLPASPVLESDLTRLNGADVVLVFIESYGAVTYDRPAFAAKLRDSRAKLETAATDTGRRIVSAFVISPTFGGSSWLAHLSLLSGIQVRDPDTYALVMSQPRQTLVTFFRDHGYRAVAVMPGLQTAWPEGAFYHFDQIYGEQSLDYQGWPFGWWAVPDEYSLAKLDAAELDPAKRRPVFAFFPTVSTHAPFSPTPPYQPDWGRMLGSDPYDQDALDSAFAEPPDWLDLSPDYVRSVEYDLTALAGFVRQRAGHDLVLVMLGDHQPASMVSGKHAPWDVPVHIIASPGPLMDRLVAEGFHAGVTPPRTPLGTMNELGPMLLSAFGDSHAPGARAETIARP